MGQGFCALAGPRTTVLAAAGTGRLQECQQGAGQRPREHQQGAGQGPHQQHTRRCGLQRATNSCAASASNASLTQPGRVSPVAHKPLPLHWPPCQSPHSSLLQSSWTSDPMYLPSARTSLSWPSWSSNMPKVSHPASPSPLAAFLVSYPGL